MKMAEKEENPLFVGISGGDELRRGMLECSKGILESLKEYENFKSFREEKLGLIRKFRGEVKGISKLINSLRTCLPKVKDVGIKKPEVKKVEKAEVVKVEKPGVKKVEKIKVEKPKVVKIEKPKAKTELEKLEDELRDIEGKLNSLS